MTTLRRTRKNPSSPVLVFFQSNFNLIVFCFICITCFSVLNYSRHRILFPVHHVSVHGAVHVDHQKLQESLLPLMSGGFFSLRPAKIREHLLQMPWVADAQVMRIWPDEVVIAIHEREPVAYWNQNGLMSAAGIIFSPDKKTFPSALPAFIGPEGMQLTLLDFYRQMNVQLQPLGTHIAKIEFTPMQSVNVQLANGIWLHLGHKDILTRMNHFVKVYSHIVGNRADKVDYVDLRYADGFAVRWKKTS